MQLTIIKREEGMKKIVVVLLGVLFLFGCAAARESGFYEHNTMYTNCSHLAFSVGGYTNVTPKKAEMSKAQNWWGITYEGTK
jgi:hypothetical protein